MDMLTPQIQKESDLKHKDRTLLVNCIQCSQATTGADNLDPFGPCSRHKRMPRKQSDDSVGKLELGPSPVATLSTRTSSTSRADWSPHWKCQSRSHPRPVESLPERAAQIGTQSILSTLPYKLYRRGQALTESIRYGKFLRRSCTRPEGHSRKFSMGTFDRTQLQTTSDTLSPLEPDIGRSAPGVAEMCLSVISRTLVKL
jgi:hypothetical protein